MNKISWRHHYIPRFYLDCFTTKNGTFKIFDIQKKKFIKNGGDFYPKSYFFEPKGNSMIFDQIKTDFMENSYKKIDDKTAKVFNKLLSSNNALEINNDDIALLEYFIGIMHWRIPSQVNQIQSIIGIGKLKEIGLTIVNHEENLISEEEFEIKFKNDINFLKALKFLLPGLTYSERFECQTPRHIISIPDGLPLICSDNPIICIDPSSFKVYSDDLVFPLTSNKLFIRGQKIFDFMSTVKIEIDMLNYKQAKKYVSCTDESYIFELEKIYTQNNFTLNDLRKSIFKQILNYSF